MARPCVFPSSLNMKVSRLGCDRALLRSCSTGWLEAAVFDICGIRFSPSLAVTARTGKYPKIACVCLPVLVPWQRRQVSYWFTAGLNTVTPSVALIPNAPSWEGRIAGGCTELKEVTAWEACGLWQSTQVACRLLFNTAGSP